MKSKEQPENQTPKLVSAVIVCNALGNLGGMEAGE